MITLPTTVEDSKSGTRIDLSRVNFPLNEQSIFDQTIDVLEPQYDFFFEGVESISTRTIG